jgi:Brp/Blh family beta-carotene 15,15'-monooxygenase
MWIYTVSALSSPHAWSTPHTDRAPRFIAARCLPLAAILAALAVGWAWPGLARVMGPWVFIASAFVLGLPHGALDWAIHARREAQRGVHGLRLLRSFLPYVGVMAVCAGALLVAPSVTLLLFLGLAAWHFGIVDARALLPSLQRGWLLGIIALSRGLLVVSLPFAADPARAWAPFAAIVDLVGGANVVAPAALADVARVAAASGAGLFLVGWLALALGKHRRMAGRLLLETLAAAALFLTLPPLFAVGVWFLAVHSLRHALLAPVSASQTSSSLLVRLIQLHYVALPLLIPGLVLLGVAGIFAGAVTPLDWAALVIAFYAVVTLPHHILTSAIRS